MPARKTNRREFLTGQAALQAASGLVPELPDQRDGTSSGDMSHAWPAGADEIAYLVQISRRAMACEFQVLCNAGQYPSATEAALEALDLVEALEDQMTVYREPSEVNRINCRAADQAVPVEQRLFELLELAVSLYHETEGAFDITAGPLSRAWGFHHRAGRLPAANDVAAALQRVGSNWLELDPNTSTVRFRRPGMEINLGAIGKGYALDRCAERMLQRGIEDFLIHGGQSSVRGCGSRLSAGQNQGWCVALRHPLKPDERLAEIWLRDRSLGTSGSGNQFFYFQGRRYGHLLDPRTGMSVERLFSATVLAPTATLADALSTAIFVMGVEKAAEFCESHADLSALLVAPGPRAGPLALHALNLDDDDWRRLSD